VKINLKDITEENYVKETIKKANDLANNADEMCAKILKAIDERC